MYIESPQNHANEMEMVRQIGEIPIKNNGGNSDLDDPWKKNKEEQMVKFNRKKEK